ncbi:MAG: hypothetical protein ACLFR2_12120 [Candidatus Kapaibacterium sp.]
MKTQKNNLIILFLFFVIISCKEEGGAPPGDREKTNNKETGAESTLEVPEGMILFSGFLWKVNYTENFADSRNFCLTHKENIRVNDDGSLELKIRKRGEYWYGAEIISDSVFGYGDFVFYVDGFVDELDENSTFTLISRNVAPYGYSGLTEAGIRFSSWVSFEATSPLEYYLYSTEKKYAEVHEPRNEFDLDKPASTHKVSINPYSIGFASFKGFGNPTAQVIDRFTVHEDVSEYDNEISTLSYSKTNDSNKVIMNLCLPEANKPATGKEVIIKINKFEFIPYRDQLSTNEE